VIRYERIGAAAVLTIDRPERRNAVDGPTAERLGEAYAEFAADDDAASSSSPATGDAAFCAGADLKALKSLRAAASWTRRAARLHPPDSAKPTIAAIGGWCLAGGPRAGAVVRPAHRHRGRQLGFPERRWGVPLIDGGHAAPAADRRPGPRADLILSGASSTPPRRARGAGSPRSSTNGTTVDRALQIAEGLASFPQDTMLADRAAALASFGHPARGRPGHRGGGRHADAADRAGGRIALRRRGGRGGAGAGV
jgi:enoyl-CoA hydratase